MSPRKKTPDFEQSLAELETLVSAIEQGDLSLEQSLVAFEQGVRLTKECQQRLQDAEQRVQVLVEQNGELVTRPLDAEADRLSDDTP